MSPYYSYSAYTMPLLPNQAETFAFIAGTHFVERLPCSMGDIEETYSGQAKIPNAYADGHLRAMNYVFNRLVGKPDFPARNPNLITDVFRSDLSLYWLKELNSIMLSPLLSHPIISQDPNAPQRQFLGNWRTIEAMNTFSMAPHTSILPKVMYLWLLDISTLNSEVYPLLDQAYGITKEKAFQLEKTAYEASLFISTVQPFVDANNRLGRIVENALRLHWHFPLKNCSKDLKYEKYIRDIVEYQQKELQEYIERAKKVK